LNIMFSLPEQLLSLAIGETGTDPLGSVLDRGLIAAALIDLVLQGYIVRREPGVFTDEPVSINSAHAFWHNEATYHIYPLATATGSSYLDHVLATLALHPRSDWLHTFATLTLLYLDSADDDRDATNRHSAPPDQRSLAAEDLLRGGQLSVASNPRWFGRRTVLKHEDETSDAPRIHRQLRRDLQRRFMGINEQRRALLMLIAATQITRQVWGAHHEETANRQMLTVLENRMQPNTLLQVAFRYVRLGTDGESMVPLQQIVPIPA